MTRSPNLAQNRIPGFLAPDALFTENRWLSVGGLYNVVSRCMANVGLHPKHRGPHALRHACAVHLVTQGLSLKEIGDHLGHRSTSATRIYAKVNLPELRLVADVDLAGLS